MYFAGRLCGNIPLNSPVYHVVAGNHGGCPVEDLRADAAECVEDGVVGGAGEGVLAVHRDAVRDDALLREATWELLELHLDSHISKPQRSVYGSCPAVESARDCVSHERSSIVHRSSPGISTGSGDGISQALTKVAPVAEVPVSSTGQQASFSEDTIECLNVTPSPAAKPAPLLVRPSRSHSLAKLAQRGIAAGAENRRRTHRVGLSFEAQR